MNSLNGPFTRTLTNFAREHRLLVSVRGGGHNVAGLTVCDGGLIIDLSPMRGVWVDPPLVSFAPDIGQIAKGVAIFLR